MARTIKVKSHCEITIRRPDGKVEIVRKDFVDSALFAQIKQATKAAGRGECLSWSQVMMDMEVPAEWDAMDAAERAYDAGTAAVYGAMDHAAESKR